MGIRQILNSCKIYWQKHDLSTMPRYDWFVFMLSETAPFKLCPVRISLWSVYASEFSLAWAWEFGSSFKIPQCLAPLRWNIMEAKDSGQKCLRFLLNKSWVVADGKKLILFTFLAAVIHYIWISVICSSWRSLLFSQIWGLWRQKWKNALKTNREP